MIKATTVMNHFRERLTQNEIGLWFVLSFIYERAEQGVQTRITDLVQQLEFGTGPTVYKKVQDLHQQGMIDIAPCNNDMRAKYLSVTKAAKQQFSELSKSLNQLATEGGA